jgi:CheY-like chemotaxis protein
MHHDTELSDFIDQLRSICDAGDSGSVVFFNEDGGWGKIAIHCGEIGSVRYGADSGALALRHITGLSRVRYHLRVEAPSLDPCPPLDDGIGSDNFFRFFEHSAGARKRGAMKPNGSLFKAVMASPASPVSPARRRFKVLVADDSRVVRKVLVRILTDHGLEVVEAANGFEALGQLEKESPDLVILDLMMPGIDGYQVTEQMRQRRRFRDLPVLMLTSRDSLFDRLKGKLSDSDEYLTKPVDGERLLKIIDRYLGR